MIAVSSAFAARPHCQGLPFTSLQLWCSSGASMPKRRYSIPSSALRESPSIALILASGPKGDTATWQYGHPLRHAILLFYVFMRLCFSAHKMNHLFEVGHL